MVKRCEIETMPNGKLRCKTHNQSLLYGWVIDGKLRFCCQIGEDEAISEYIEKQERTSSPVSKRDTSNLQTANIDNKETSE